MSTAILDREKSAASNYFGALSRGKLEVTSITVGLAVLALVAMGVVYCDIVTGAKFDREGDD